MARLVRLAFAAQSHLVVLTGDGLQPLFVDDEDRRRFTLALLECSRACGVAVHAYSLLDEQVLMLAAPALAGSLQSLPGARGRGSMNRHHPWPARAQFS